MTAAAATENPGPADVVAAHRLVKDLSTPDPRFYWGELTVTGTAAWASLLAAIIADSPALTMGLLFPAVLLWYRAAAMVHELTHQRHDELPGFHFAWNVVVGVAWLLPSVMYEGAHNGHHKKTTYGTADDPEYLPLAGRPLAVLGYLAFAVVVFPLMLTRFLVLAPVSWVVPPVRRFVIRSGSSYSINLGFVRKMSPAERRRLVRWECAVLIAWVPPILLSASGVIGWKWLVCWYTVYTAVLVVNRVRMLTAHHFALDGRPTDYLGQFADSIDTPAGWWAELWAPLGMRYHALHHLFPTLPYHNMRAAYRRLTGQLPPASFYHAATGRGLLPTLKKLLTGAAKAGPRTSPPG